MKLKPWQWIGLGGGLLFFFSKLKAAGMVNIIDITNELPKGAGSYPTRPLEAINMFVLHHSATTSGDPWAYARYHVQNNGWPGIGYHFVIQKDGKVYQTNKLTTSSYHASGVNSQSIGICLTGSYDNSQPPAAQYTALIGLLRHLRDTLGQKPIYGHNQFSSKSCPGSAVDVASIEADAWGLNV